MVHLWATVTTNQVSSIIAYITFVIVVTLIKENQLFLPILSSFWGYRGRRSIALEWTLYREKKDER
jgi:hypothetical protein